MPYTNNDEGKRYTIVGTKNTLIPEHGTAPRTYKQKAHDKAVALRTGHIDDADAGAEGAIDLVTSDRHPIHFFNMSFWPLPGSIRTASTTEDASTVLFDPHVNSFDLVKKEAEDITLVCEICHARLQVLRCETCRMGYCFSCGFTAHAKDQRQRHRITMAAPRVVSTTVVGTSLIYHLDIAKQVRLAPPPHRAAVVCTLTPSRFTVVRSVAMPPLPPPPRLHCRRVAGQARPAQLGQDAAQRGRGAAHPEGPPGRQGVRGTAPTQPRPACPTSNPPLTPDA